MRLEPTPTQSGITQRLGDFDTLLDALDYAAKGQTGLNFYSGKGELVRVLSYAGLCHEARALAGRLLGAGLVPGERVALVAETTPDFIIAFYACQYAGLVPAPVPLAGAFGGRAAYMEHIGRLVVEMRATCLLAPESLSAWLAPLHGKAALRLCGTVASLADAPALALPEIDPQATAYLQFSSGSTRFPLGVMVDHRAAMANVSALLRHGLEIGPNDRAISWLPLYHDMGLVGFLISPVSGQMTVDLLATQDFARRPMLWLSLISSQRCTVSYSPSFGFDLCIRRVKMAQGLDLNLSSWRIAGIGGDMIRPAVLDLFARTYAPQGFSACAFLPSYGMAEATLGISIAPTGRGIETDTLDLDLLEQENIAVAPRSEGRRTRTLVVCGPPLPNQEVEIRAEDGTLCGERKVGRILVRGPSLMRGYDGPMSQTEPVLSAEGWLDTADLGYWLDGALVITGRAKDLIIINGRNVWPQDLEWTVEQAVPEIRTGDVAAFSVEEDGQEILILAAEARAGVLRRLPAALAEAVSDAVRSAHGLDGRVILLPANTLPYTSSGKLSRATVRRRYLAGTLAAACLPA